HAYTLRGPSTKECPKTTPGTRYPHRSVLDTALPVLNSVARHFVELLAACVSAALGSQWGAATLLSGFAQGIGVEIVFAIFAYRSFNLLVATIAGLAAGVGAWTLELFTSGHLARSVEYNIIYLVCTGLSGAILAGVLGYFTVKALAATGALDRFAAGREA
ncbi:ECF transporter S component, partial [Corynebacterium striatum]